MRGLILKGIGGFYYVMLQNSTEVVECKACGRFRKEKIKPMVGDMVEVTIDDGRKGYIERIFSRKNEIIRPPLANVDKGFVVVTPTSPQPNFLLIDKIIAICEIKGIEPIIVINKTDLQDGEEIEKTYTDAGYKVIKTSAKMNSGIDDIKKEIKGSISFFAGGSGIGKSSIINLISDEINMEVGEISDKISRGKHTTRHVELFPLDCGGFIADTPGFSSFDLERLENVKKGELSQGFREIYECEGECKFTGCSHTVEKGCAVLQKYNNGNIAQTRMDSYIKLYNELKNIKEWEK